MSATHLEEQAQLSAFLKRTLWVCLTLTLGLGFAKLQIQKARPPNWLKPTHTYAGYVSIDGYSHTAEAIHQWYLGADSGAARVRARLAHEGHPTALLVPALVAALALILGSIPGLLPPVLARTARPGVARGAVSREVW